ncbi:MAG: ABC transporter ATP-binding protein [Rhodospirillales bacterium]|nr:ABC transporter ATP-binding protein [Rhodospirillales bacterium]
MIAPAPPLLEIDDLRVQLRVEGGAVPVIGGVSLSIRPGEVLALVGESGSGKSVTAQSILRLLPRTMPIAGGKILFRERPDAAPVDLAAIEPDGAAIQAIRGNRIAMIFQEPMSSFSPVHSIGSQIGDVLRLHRRLEGAALRKAMADLLDKVGIPNPARAIDRFPHEFSGGMRQRAMIAKALACNPALLIADEPTTALDVTIQAQILDLIRNLKTELGMAVIFITHDLGIVAQMADSVAIMYTGRIVEHGPVRAIFRNPQHPYTADLLRAVPRLGGLGVWRSLKPIQGSVPNLYAMPQGCSFHPRCASFMPGRCDAAAPALYLAGPGHEVRCFLREPARLGLAS